MSKGKIEITFNDNDTKIYIDGELSVFNGAIALGRVMGLLVGNHDVDVTQGAIQIFAESLVDQIKEDSAKE